MHSRRTRSIAGAAALAAVASVAFISSAAQAALPPGAPPVGAATITPATGTGATTFNLLPPSGAVCPGDSATGGYRWQTFFVGAALDPAALTYNSSGPVATGGNFAQPMFAAGTPVVNRNTAVTTGLITGIPTMSFATFPAGFVPAGSYQAGFACTLGGATESYFSMPLTITANPAGGQPQISYAYGATPTAPVLSATLTAGDQTLTGSFTAIAAVPAVSGYTVTAVPTTGTTVTLPVAAPGAFTLTGLVNDVVYSVSVTATNTVGTSLASNSVTGQAHAPDVVLPAPTNVTGAATAPGATTAIINWVAPTGQAPTGYTVVISPSVAGSPFAVAAGTTSQTVPCALGTAYTATVTPIHPVGFSAPAATSPSYTCNAAQMIIQDITVDRPVGTLVLTQRCGVYGPLADATVANDGFGTLPALAASTNQVGTSPTLTPGGAVDPQFGNYPAPAPAAYPTHCGIDLNPASLVTSGPRAGQYYTASGRLNQVTVLDTRDTDLGWTLNGTMSDFTTVGDSFSGNYLGWQPSVTGISAPTLGGYAQTVNAGATVAPFAPGLGTAKTLASAPVAAGSGIASIDARLKLLIPIDVKNGTYTGTLTFTVV